MDNRHKRIEVPVEKSLEVSSDADISPILGGWIQFYNLIEKCSVINYGKLRRKGIFRCGRD